MWGDIDSCEALEGPFERIVALELLCYLPDPQSTARRLASMLAPGGSLIVSVEAWPGALLTDSTGLSADEVGERARAFVTAYDNAREAA